ncbi:MAG: hypothetical protein R3E03_00460 [Novosphingobium sp.]
MRSPARWSSPAPSTAPTVVRHLNAAGVNAAAIHGNKSQAQHRRAGRVPQGHHSGAGATDIAARAASTCRA